MNDPRATLTEEQARAIYQQGEEAVVFALLTLSKRRAELAAKPGRQQGAKVSTPSGMTAVYEKPPTNRCGKPPGQKEGPPGVRGAAPVPDRSTAGTQAGPVPALWKRTAARTHADPHADHRR